MISVVVDTNVLVSGLLSEQGPPGRIVEWLIAGELQAVLDDRIFSEYHRVLHYPRLSLPSDSVNDVLSSIRRHGVTVSTSIDFAGLVLDDRSDEPFAQCALSAAVPLITGNKRHFPKEQLPSIPLLSPAEFLTWLPG